MKKRVRRLALSENLSRQRADHPQFEKALLELFEKIK
jgi:hypothetical protein